MGQQRNPLKHEKTLKPANNRSDAFTFSDHVRELRRRIVWVALAFFVTSGLAYNYHDQLVQFVMAPLNGEKLIYLTPGGGFAFIFQITLYAGLITAAPVLMYQLYRFMQPTLPTYAKRSAVKVAFFATLLMIVGVTYGYFVAIPAALTFLSTFAGAEIIPNLTADSYLSFFLAYVGGLALLFQLPLLLIFWHWIRPMTPGGLIKSERFIILFAFIAAAIITPTPDVINQSMIAVPLIAIYQIGVVTVLASIWRARRQSTAPDNAEVTPFVPEKEVAIVPQTIKEVKPLATPLVPITPPQLRPLRRSIDGFNSRAVRPTQTPRPAARPLAIPPRSAPRESLLNRRPILRIDGMSPL